MKDYIVSLRNKKIIFVCSVFICTALCGILGLVVPALKSRVYSSEIEEYENNLAEYESVLSEIEESIGAAETQVHTLEEYCEKSVLMQMDASATQTAAVQYTFSGSNSALGINTLAAYINDGALKSEIAGVVTDTAGEYLDEIIVCTTLNPTLSVTVMHYDMEQASVIRDAIADLLESQISELTVKLSNLSLIDTEKSQVVTVNSSVMNTQNTNLNNLKNYKSSLSDLQKKLVDQRTNRDKFIENNAAGIPQTESRKVTIVKYAAFGVILGVVLPAAFYALRYYLSDAIKGSEELMASGLPVLGQTSRGQDYHSTLGKSCVKIQILANQDLADTVALIRFGKGNTWEEITDFYTNTLMKSGVSVVKVSSRTDKWEEARKLSHIGHCVLLVEKGKTTCQQLEEYRQFCAGLKITIWGCVIIG